MVGIHIYHRNNAYYYYFSFFLIFLRNVGKVLKILGYKNKVFEIIVGSVPH